MSYNIRLEDPVTDETAEVPGHLMIGGTYKADYHPETGRMAIKERHALANIKVENFCCIHSEICI